MNLKDFGYDSPCKDCSEDTVFFGYYTMYSNEAWEAAHKPSETRDGYLCLPCFEKRLDRVLTASDFLPCAINAEIVEVAEDPDSFPDEILKSRIIDGITQAQRIAYRQELQELAEAEQAA